MGDSEDNLPPLPHCASVDGAEQQLEAKHNQFEVSSGSLSARSSVSITNWDSPLGRGEVSAL